MRCIFKKHIFKRIRGLSNENIILTELRCRKCNMEFYLGHPIFDSIIYNQKPFRIENIRFLDKRPLDLFQEKRYGNA